MIDTNEKKYDFDVVIYDDVGSPITEEAATRPMGGSEYHLLQLTRGLVERGFTVRLCQKRDGLIEGPLGRSGPIRCRVMVHSRYSPIPSPQYIQADRVVVFATDMPGDATGSVAEDGGAYKHLAPLFRARHPDIATTPATLVCVSEWQRGLFPRAWGSVVIPPFIDDRAYELGRTLTTRVPKRFIYASAAMKGLLPTLRKWADLEKQYPREMAGAELHVTTNWDEPNEECRAFFQRPDIKWRGRLTPSQVQDELAHAEGLFYCNEFPETFGAVAAVAEACNARAHILCLNSPGGIPEATRGPWVTMDEETFEKMFVATMGVGSPVTGRATPFRDCSVTATMPLWLSALGLDAHKTEDAKYFDGEGYDLHAFEKDEREKERDVKSDANPVFIDTSHLPPNSVGYRIMKEDGTAGEYRDLKEHHAKYESSTPPAMPSPRPVTRGEEIATLEEKYAINAAVAARRGELYAPTYRASPAGLSGPAAPWVCPICHKPGCEGTHRVITGLETPPAVEPASQPTKAAWDAWTPAAKENWRRMTMRNRRRYANEHPGSFERTRELQREIDMYDSPMFKKVEPIEPALSDIDVTPSKKVTIGLVMIAKNEAAVIERALSSVKGIVDAITVVVDDQTDDATEEIVRAFGGNNRIPTWVGRRPWRGGFAKTRNEAIELAIEHRKTIYLLLLDCDDTYCWGADWPDPSKQNLYAEIYDAAIEDSGITYARPVLLRADAGFRFEGRHHEYIVRGDGGTGYSPVRLQGVTYRRLPGGSANATPEARSEKYSREALVFEEEVARAESEGRVDHRSMYYAGQSWMDAGDRAKAATWSRRRGQAGGYHPQETFVAWMNLGHALYPALTAAEGYLEAYKMTTWLKPSRAGEALHGLARLYNENKLFALTWGLPDLTSTDGKAPEGLFVQVEVYTWRMLYEYAIAATYLANAGGGPPVGHISKGFAESLWKALLRKAPAEQHEGIRKNMGFLNTGSPPLSKKPLLPAYTEFRQRLLAVDLSACSVLDNWKAKCEAAQTWVRTGDLESFVGWSTDLDMNDHSFTTRCYEDLQRDPQWERWKRLSRKSPYGNQHVLVADPEASVVGVSQAFHLMQYENATGERFVDNIDLVLEVGGGYGNLARVLRLDGFSGIHIIVDLPHIREFQKLFLELNDIDVIFYEDDDKDVDDGVWLATEDRLDDAIEMITHVHDLNESAFVSTWGLSETPLAFRGKLFPEIFKESALRKYLIATQWYEWGGVDNVAWFTEWEAEAAKSMVRVSTEVPHHEQQRHLFGCKPELVKK